MLFITNRALNEGPTAYRDREDGTKELVVPRNVSFNLRDNQSQQSVYYCYRNSENNYTELGSQEFLTALKEARYQQILIFIHGFSSLPERDARQNPGIFDMTLQLQQLFDQKEPQAVLVVPLIWPCDNDFGMVKDYYDDQIAADASAFAFMRLLERFLMWRRTNSTLDDPCLKRINVLSHSMGNRVLRGTLQRTVTYYQAAGLPMIFRNIFMVAADVVNETLEPGQAGADMASTTRNLVVYYSPDDLALRASKVANARDTSRRLGHTGPESLNKVSRNVYALDCADFNNEYDAPTGHTYFLRDTQGQAGLLFDHLWECVRTGRVPMASQNLRRQILNRPFWRD